MKFEFNLMSLKANRKVFNVHLKMSRIISQLFLGKSSRACFKQILRKIRHGVINNTGILSHKNFQGPLHIQDSRTV